MKFIVLLTVFLLNLIEVPIMYLNSVLMKECVILNQVGECDCSIDLHRSRKWRYKLNERDAGTYLKYIESAMG